MFLSQLSSLLLPYLTSMLVIHNIVSSLSYIHTLFVGHIVYNTPDSIMKNISGRMC